MDSNVKGLQHIGIPTCDMDGTIAFYRQLGFIIAFQTELEGSPVCFLQGMGLIVEAYCSHETAGKTGAIDHIALEAEDIEEAWNALHRLGLTPLEESIRYLPFWEHGVRFFTIMGPNAEKIEFNQRL
ncbi:MAG: VOC family protein [Eubacteriales bacterium]|nr:VOC family protein [Eubacteriales bacterium]